MHVPAAYVGVVSVGGGIVDSGVLSVDGGTVDVGGLLLVGVTVDVGGVLVDLGTVDVGGAVVVGDTRTTERGAVEIGDGVSACELSFSEVAVASIDGLRVTQWVWSGSATVLNSMS